jgi:serine acetyltransferase
VGAWFVGEKNGMNILRDIVDEKGTIIQAGSVMVKDIAVSATAGGHPTGVYSRKDKEHYEALKKEERFH